MKPVMMKATLAAMLGVAAVAGCRGGVSEDPPLHLAPDMDLQAHRRPQSPSKVFADGRAGRTPDPHTVARGHLRIDRARYEGVDESGKHVKRIPYPETLTQATLDRGEERYNIYCAPCHDKSGSGNGAIPRRLVGTPDQAAFSDIPNFTLPRLKQAPDGEIFEVITKGKGRMPSYASQVPEDDRWAIIAWLRVLQEMGGSTAGGTK